MTIWVIGFLVALFTYITWGLNAIYRALDWDPLDPTMSAFCEKDASEGQT